MNGVGSKWRSNFSGSLLLGMVVIQYYSVFMTAMHNYPYDGVEAYRWDCLQSTKGGKISRAMFYEGSERALNPCYCHANATCKYKSGVKVSHYYFRRPTSRSTDLRVTRHTTVFRLALSA